MSVTNISPQEVDQRRRDGKAALFVDVRTPGEYAALHAEGARSIPLDQLRPETLPRTNGDPVYVIDHGALAQPLLKPVARDWFTKSNEQLGARIRGDHVPKLALRFASHSAGNISRRMNLQRQLLLRIENFDKQRKTWVLRHFTEDFPSMLGPQFMQRFPAHRPT